MSVDFVQLSDLEITVDLTPLNGAQIHGVRYAWKTHTDTVCCDEHDPLMFRSKPCAPASCPLMSSSGLPANPFLARIVNGRCECIPPQKCDWVNGTTVSLVFTDAR